MDKNPTTGADEKAPDAGTEQNPADAKIDYGAELEAEKKRGKPDPVIAAQAFKERRKKDGDEGGDDDEENDDDKPLTRREARELFQSEQKNSPLVLDMATRISDSPEEAALIVEIHKNRTFPAGMTLQDQIEESYAIANRKKLPSKAAELARAGRSSDAASRDAATTYRDGQSGTQPKMSASDTASYERAGFKFNLDTKLWEKKLPSGKTLVKDPVTKRTELR